MSNLNFLGCENDFQNCWDNLAHTLRNKKYSQLNFCDLLKLKELVKDVNNVATYRLTLAFVGWLLKVGIINQNNAGEMIENSRSQNPNANGYDVVYTVSLNGKNGIIAEVKCNIPISRNNLGAQKKFAIDHDISGLLNRKKSAKLDTTNYYKFMVLMSDALSPITSHLHKKYESQIYICDGKKPIWYNNVSVVNIVPMSISGCDLSVFENFKKFERTNKGKKKEGDSPKIKGWDIEDLLGLLKEKGLLKELAVGE
jgi:hypothetical protein